MNRGNNMVNKTKEKLGAYAVQHKDTKVLRAKLFIRKQDAVDFIQRMCSFIDENTNDYQVVKVHIENLED